MRFTTDRRQELDAFRRRRVPEQPNRGRHECTVCGMILMSEAGATYHRKVRGPRSDNVCLTATQMRRAGFTTADGRVWKIPATIEYWFLEELQKESRRAMSGFTKEAWRVGRKS